MELKIKLRNNEGTANIIDSNTLSEQVDKDNEKVVIQHVEPIQISWKTFKKNSTTLK